VLNERKEKHGRRHEKEKRLASFSDVYSCKSVGLGFWATFETSIAKHLHNQTNKQTMLLTSSCIDFKSAASVRNDQPMPPHRLPMKLTSKNAFKPAQNFAIFEGSLQQMKLEQSRKSSGEGGGGWRTSSTYGARKAKRRCKCRQWRKPQPEKESHVTASKISPASDMLPHRSRHPLPVPPQILS
jgi:hypothetical protein